MKQFIRCLTVFTLVLCSFLFVGQKTYATYTRYTLTAVFYDDDDVLTRFMTEGLKYEFRDVNSKDDIIGFSEKIPNPLRTHGMNTIHHSNTTKTVTKLIPIDSRKIKTMLHSERIKLQKLLSTCMAGIILFDYSDPRLGIFQDFWVSRDCKTFLEHDFTFNHVFKLMGSVRWGNFVGLYTYNASKLTKEQWEKQYSNLQQYMASLERFFEVDNRWNTRCQTEKVEAGFKSISDSGSGALGSATELIRNEPLVKEYLRTNGIVLESTPPTTTSLVPSVPISLQLEADERLAKELQEQEEKIIKPKTIIQTTETSPDARKLQEIEAVFLGLSPKILRDEIRTLEAQIQRNAIEIESKIKITKYDSPGALYAGDAPIKTDGLDNKELCKHIKELKEKLQIQKTAVQTLEAYKELPWYKKWWF